MKVGVVLLIKRSRLKAVKGLLPQRLMLIVSLLTPFSISSAGTNTPTNLRCFNCIPLGHTRKLCPNRALGNASNTSRKVVTSAGIHAYAIGNTNSSSVGEWRVHGKNDNCHSSRDVIDPHDEPRVS